MLDQYHRGRGFENLVRDKFTKDVPISDLGLNENEARAVVDDYNTRDKDCNPWDFEYNSGSKIIVAKPHDYSKDRE